MPPRCSTSSALPHEAKVVSAHRTPERLYDYATQRGGARPEGDHRRRRRRGASARHGRVDDPPAGARRAGRDARRSTASTACSRSSRCRPGSRSARSRSARRARPMPGCSPPRSSPPPMRRSAERLEAWRAAADRRRGRSARMIVPPGSTIGIIGGGQLGRMLAWRRPRLGYRCHVYAPDADAAGRRGRRALHPRRLRRRRGAGALRPARSTSSPTSSRMSRSRRSQRSPAGCRCIRRSRRWRSPRIGSTEKRSSKAMAAARRPSGGRRPGRARRGAGGDRRARDPEDPPLRL